MKFLAILLLFGILYLCQADDEVNLDELIKIMEPLVADCDPKPEREHIEELLLMKEDAQMETKCLRYCLLEQFEMIDGSQMIEDKTSDMLGMLFNESHDKLKDVVSICNKENSGVKEKCENAHAHGMCYKRELLAHGFEMPKFS